MRYTHWSKNKYNAQKVVTPEGVFDSKKEYSYWMALKIREDRGEIQNLRRQVKYELIPAQYSEGDVIQKGPHKGERKKGKLIERECAYFADFVYDEQGETVVIDIKGMSKRLPEYVIKRKLMLWLHHLRITEV